MPTRRALLFGAFVAAVAVRGFVLASPDAVTRLVDDAFLCFDISRTLGTSLHFNTSGCQPLYVILCAPVFAILRPASVADLDAAARVCLGVCVLGDLVAMFLLTGLLRRASGPVAAAVGAWLWALHPAVVGFATNGLETSWALAGLFGAILVAEYGRRDWVTGAVIGLAMMARIDLAALGAGVVLFAFVDARGGPEPRRTFAKRCGAFAGGWAAVYVTWLTVLFLQTGDVLPVSGAASHQLGEIVRRAYDAEGGPSYATLMFLVGATRSLFAAPLFAAAALLLSPYVDFRPYRLLLLQCAAVAVFYVGYQDVVWYLERYLVPLLALEIVVASAGVAALCARPRAWRFAPAAACLALVALAAYRYHVHLFDDAEPVVTYCPTARGFAATLEPDAVVAALESGALAYYIPGRVVNADGVVNRPAYEAIRDGTLGAYLRSRGVTHFIATDAMRPMLAGLVGGVRYHDGGQRYENVGLYAIDWSLEPIHTQSAGAR